MAERRTQFFWQISAHTDFFSFQETRKRQSKEFHQYWFLHTVLATSFLIFFESDFWIEDAEELWTITIRLWLYILLLKTEL